MNKAYTQKKERARYLDRTGRHAAAKALWQEVHAMPSVQTDDPDYRRLRYVRYADDFLLGFTGPHAEAQEIKAHLATFLRETLKLDLSEEKTLITHARTEPARFLGYDVGIAANDTQRNAGKRTLNGNPTLAIPPEVVQRACRRYMANGKPVHRMELTHNEAFSIVATYQAEYRGLVEYYRMAHNLRRLSELRWVMETSLTKTLAHKHRTSVQAIYRRFAATVKDEQRGTVKVLQVRVERPEKRPLVATWGGISLARKVSATLDDRPPVIYGRRTELVQRLLAERCELCGATERLEVHHIRKLADLKKHGRTPPRWVQTMAERRRKTLVLCHTCHQLTHAGKARPTIVESSGEPDDAKVSRPVRRGADGKVPA
jgi:hypothetical protein